MVREVLTISVGQCGIQLGSVVWEQYCAEHGVITTGENPSVESHSHGHKKNRKRRNDQDHSFQCFFDETGAGRFVPRQISVDLEPNVIDDIKNSSYALMYQEDSLINGKEDAANNFARGHYTVGKEIIDKVNDKIRKLSDNCNNLQGFIINHSVGGGTGSGLGALILERIAVDYRKKSKVRLYII